MAWIKAFKGFDKNMQCRGFQFEEGKEYEEEKASLCESGFHACENPLDTFSYYKPGDGSIYRSVELDAAEETEFDSKRCGKRIRIGAILSVMDICKAHFYYVKERTTNKKMGKNDANLSAQDWSSLAAKDGSSLAAQNWSSLAAKDGSSLAAQDGSSLAAQYRSSLAAKNWSSLAAQDWRSLAAQDWSSLAAQNWSSLAAQDGSSLAAKDGSSLAAGKNSVIAAFNSKAKGDMGTLIAIANREFNGNRWKITDFCAGIVDGAKIKPNTWYEVKNGEFVEVE